MTVEERLAGIEAELKKLRALLNDFSGSAQADLDKIDGRLRSVEVQLTRK